MKKRDWVWLVATITFSILFCIMLSGSSGTLDINIYDTYFVIANEYLWISLFVLIFSISYTVKNLLEGYSKKNSNLILLASLFLCIFFSIPVSQFFFMVSGHNDTLHETPTADFWSKIYLAFKTVYFLVLIFFGYSTFKTGQNWGRF